jgi:hypothetical protein
MAQNAKTRRRATCGHRNCEELPGNFNSQNSPDPTILQRDFVARRFGIAPHMAAVVAALAFERRAAR